MKDKSKTFTWDWEDGETGEIRTIEIAMPDLDRDYDPRESREILLDRKLRLDNVESRTGSRSSRRENLTDGPAKRQQKTRKSADRNDQLLSKSRAVKPNGGALHLIYLTRHPFAGTRSKLKVCCVYLRGCWRSRFCVCRIENHPRSKQHGKTHYRLPAHDQFSADR